MQKTLEIESLMLMVRLGVHDFETELPQGVTVDIHLQVAPGSDLVAAGDYSKIGHFLQGKVQDRTFHLVESLAEYIWYQLQENETAVTYLKVNKTNPPCLTSGVTIDRVACVIRA